VVVKLSLKIGVYKNYQTQVCPYFQDRIEIAAMAPAQ